MNTVIVYLFHTSYVVVCSVGTYQSTRLILANFCSYDVFFTLTELWGPCHSVMQSPSWFWAGCLCLLWYHGYVWCSCLGDDYQCKWARDILGKSNWTEVGIIPIVLVNAFCVRDILQTLCLAWAWPLSKCFSSSSCHCHYFSLILMWTVYLCFGFAVFFCSDLIFMLVSSCFCWPMGIKIPFFSTSLQIFFLISKPLVHSHF